MGVYFAILDNKNVVEYADLEQQIINYLLKFEDIINNTNRNKTICTYCNKNELDDEFHYIFDGPFFEQDRNIYIPEYYYSRQTVFKI